MTLPSLHPAKVWPGSEKVLAAKVTAVPSSPEPCGRGAAAAGARRVGVGVVDRRPLGGQDDGRAATGEGVGGAGGVGDAAVAPPREGVARVREGVGGQGDGGAVEPRARGPGRCRCRCPARRSRRR